MSANDDDWRKAPRGSRGVLIGDMFTDFEIFGPVPGPPIVTTSPSRSGKPLPSDLVHLLARKRLSEVAALLDWRRTHGVLSDPWGIALAIANCLHVLGRAGEGPLNRVLAGHGVDLDPKRIPVAVTAAEADFFTSDEAGRLLDLTVAELASIRENRAAFSTLAPSDENEGQRAKRRAEWKLERQLSRRRAKGVRPRAEFLAGSVTSEARRLGVSRSTVHRRKVTGAATRLKPDSFKDRGVAPVASVVTFCPEIEALLFAGPDGMTAKEVARRTGKTISSTKVSLGRLFKADRVSKPGRGRYAVKYEVSVRSCTRVIGGESIWRRLFHGAVDFSRYVEALRKRVC